MAQPTTAKPRKKPAPKAKPAAGAAPKAKPARKPPAKRPAKAVAQPAAKGRARTGPPDAVAIDRVGCAAEVTLQEPGQEPGKEPGSRAGSAPAKENDMNSDTNDETGFANQTVWLRGFQMIVVAIMMWVAGWVLGLSALLQFGWLLFTGKRNDQIAGFGSDLANWFLRAVRFQTAKSEDKPFPWAPWGKP